MIGSITPDFIESWILDNFKDIYPLDTWGEKSFFINPNRTLKRGAYFATIKAKDGDNDKASSLNRNGIYRLNMGISKAKYIELFGSLPKRPAKGCIIDGDYNFQQSNEVLPHPVYGWMSWICILNPDNEKFEQCKNLLQDAYIRSLNNLEKRLKNL